MVWKITYKFLLICIFVALVSCKDENEEEPYSNLEIVLDNAQASLYFHTIFREAENAWAFVADKNYEPFEPEHFGPLGANFYKTISCSTVGNIITATIVYQTWITNSLNLGGTIKVEFDRLSFRSSTKTAMVSLTQFSIEGQNVTGGMVLTYIAGSDNDRYEMRLIQNPTIQERGAHNMPVLISISQGSGNYERIKGGRSFSQFEDEWKYWGAISGRLRDNPNMTFTNTVVETVANEDAAVYYDMNCGTATRGKASIIISGRDDIDFEYRCNQIHFNTETHNIR